MSWKSYLTQIIIYTKFFQNQFNVTNVYWLPVMSSILWSQKSNEDLSCWEPWLRKHDRNPIITLYWWCYLWKTWGFSSGTKVHFVWDMADSRGFGYGKSKFLGSENLILRSQVFFHNEILRLDMPRLLPGSILSNYSSPELLVFRIITLREREIMKTSPC